MKICIDDLICRARVGVFDWEKNVLQNLHLNIELDVLNQQAGYSDSIDDTLSYKDLSKEILDHIQSDHFDLIERIATEVCQLVLASDQRVVQVSVEVNKPGALRTSKNVRVIDSFIRNQAIIGLGSNIEPEVHIRQARKIIAEEFNLIRCAQDLRTKAVARPDDPDFINSAVLLHTSLDSGSLQRRLKHIEWEIGRIANPDNYGARTIDLDLLVWNHRLEDADIVSRDFLQQSIEELEAGLLQHMSKRDGIRFFSE